MTAILSRSAKFYVLARHLFMSENYLVAYEMQTLDLET
ncbi:hypothetical protein SLEP1_g36676 [Rubroshorea leprosula]|uniref:Uncharacterized protein n=1 Tax=Rubroshorea leprosula TaxID=152421 RepID=A0AAV5KSG9_9ROSI|nr:hypothetical protein SLEP1_g36676 [Rubroshorea leprosula]